RLLADHDLGAAPLQRQCGGEAADAAADDADARCPGHARALPSLQVASSMAKSVARSKRAGADRPAAPDRHAGEAADPGLRFGSHHTMRAPQQENSMPSRRMRIAFALALALAPIPQASAQQKSIVVSSTTSTTDSGLFGHILPLFKQKTGIDVKVL